MKAKASRTMAENALVAAIYLAVSLLSLPLSFGMIQVRIAECLVLLCFFRKDLTLGVTLGCLITNLFSPLGMWDVLFGTLATLLSCLLIGRMRHLIPASFVPVLLNGLIVGAELSAILGLPFLSSAGFVALGEAAAVPLIGGLLFGFAGRKRSFRLAIGAARNAAFRW